MFPDDPRWRENPYFDLEAFFYGEWNPGQTAASPRIDEARNPAATQDESDTERLIRPLEEAMSVLAARVEREKPSDRGETARRAGEESP